ncbi:MAG: TetR/AcrR family transcriptional regulator [Pseudomonadales bacterium]|jgi:AcrR family transcriptional regulator|tara:strand:- start:264 stop:893 length:630 start_codon:yes stop_codon:yes gene_type:complete
MKSVYHHGDLKNALLDAADALLLREGLQGFTMRACARLAKVSHAAPAHHFGDVNALLTAVAARGYERLVALLQEKLKSVVGDLHEEMYATGLAYVEFAETYPEHFRIMFRKDLLAYSVESPPTAMAETLIELTNVILRQRGEPEISLLSEVSGKGNPVIKDILIGWCYIHGYAHLRLEGQLSMIPDDAHFKIMRENSDRLSNLLQQRAV